MNARRDGSEWPSRFSFSTVLVRHHRPPFVSLFNPSMTNTAHSLASIAAAAALFIGLCAAGSASAQAGPDFSKVEIKTTQLAPDFWTLEGQGGTISVLAGPEGILLVDSQFAPLTDKLVAAIRRFSDKPIRFLVDTHVHGDHTGGNENFARLGATIFARDQLRYRLEHPNPAANGNPGKPAPSLALPVVTYNASLSIHINGEDVRLLPVIAAHTDGDTIISFPATTSSRRATSSAASAIHLPI